MPDLISALQLSAPEAALAVGGLVLLMVGAFAGDRLDLAAGRAQSRFQRIGGVEDPGQGLPVAGAAVAAEQDPAGEGADGDRGQQQYRDQAGGLACGPAVCRRTPGGGKLPARPWGCGGSPA